MEGLLAEIIALGDKEQSLAYHAFSEQTLNFIISLFPTGLADKLAEVEGSRRDQLVAVVNKLSQFRIRAQRLGKIYGNKAPPGLDSVGKTVLPKKTPTQTSHPHAQPGRFFKNGAERYDECRICKHLAEEGKDGVYDSHLSTYPTGCPLFIAMPISQRRAVAMKCNLCVQCLDPEIVWDQSHRLDCKVTKAKIKDYTCMSEKCRTHVVVHLPLQEV